MRRDHRQHGIDHEFRRQAQQIQLFPGLARPQAFERKVRFDERDSRQFARHEFGRVGRQERALDSDTLRSRTKLPR